MTEFNLGNQIYVEGEPTWGCKSGVLDVEDVKEFIKRLKNHIDLRTEQLVHNIEDMKVAMIYAEMKLTIDELSGDKLS